VELATALPPLLARLRPKHRPTYLAQVQKVAGADPEASLEAADTLLDLLNGERVSHDGATEWVDRGLHVLERNKEVGRGYFRLGSKYSLEVLEELREGLPLKSVARILKLYATALSGRDIAIRSSEDLNTFEVYTADHIVLPPDMRVFDDERENFAAYKVATAQGAGRIEFGTYGFSLDDISDTVDSIRANTGADGGDPRIRKQHAHRVLRTFPHPRSRAICSIWSRATASTRGSAPSTRASAGHGLRLRRIER